MIRNKSGEKGAKSDEDNFLKKYQGPDQDFCLWSSIHSLAIGSSLSTSVVFDFREIAKLLL